MIAGIADLRQNELFGGLTDEELSRLAPLCSEFVAVQDAILFNEGRNARYLYIVTEGEMALQKAIRLPHGTSTRRTIVAVCAAGDALGWSAVVEPYKYSLSAISWQPSRLIRVDAKMLRRAFEMYPTLGFKVTKSLLSVMSRRLQQTADALIKDREAFGRAYAFTR